MRANERKRIGAAAGTLLLLLCGLFHQALFTPRVMSQADYLLTLPPWSRAVVDDPPWVPANALLRDQSCQFIPWRKFTVESLRAGTLPLWDPYSYCGAPFVANDQSAVFFPLTALHLVLPFHTATLVSAMLRLLVAGLGTWLLLRRLAVSWGPALVAATAFMCGGALIVWLNHPHANVTVWLPWLLLLVDRQFAPGGWRDAAALAAVIGVQFLGGHLESSSILAVAATVLLVARVARAWRDGAPLARPLALILAAVLAGSATAAVQLLPTVEYLRHSWVVEQRGGAGPDEAESAGAENAFWWRAVPALAMPRLYGDPRDATVTLPSVFDPRLGLRNFNERSGGYVGVPMLLLGLVGATLAGRRPYAACFAGLGALGFCLAYRVPPVWQLVLAIPGTELTAVMLARMQVLVGFALCVLGAFALERAAAGEPAGRPRAAPIVAGTLLAGSAAFFAWSVAFYSLERPAFARTWGWLRDRTLLPPDAAERAAATFVASGGALFVATALAAVLLWRGRRWLGRHVWIGWGAVVTVEALCFAYGYNPIVPRDSVFPATPTTRFLERHLGEHRIAVRGAFPGATTTWYGLRSISGYDAIEVLDYARLLRAREGVPPGLLRALGVRFVVTDPALPPPPGRVVHDDDTRIVELPEYLSRAWVVPHAVDVGDLSPEQVGAALRDPRFDPTTMVLLDLAGAPDAPGGAGNAAIVVDGIDEVVVEARAPEGGWLVLADTWYPGWSAEIDGRRAPLLRANLAFRAVRLEPGEHRVRFTYRPLSFIAGAWLSLVGFAAIAAMLVAGRERNAPRRDSRHAIGA